MVGKPASEPQTLDYGSPVNCASAPENHADATAVGTGPSIGRQHGTTHGTRREVAGRWPDSPHCVTHSPPPGYNEGEVQRVESISGTF